MHAGTLVFGAVPAFTLFLFLLAADAAAHLLQVAFIASGSGDFLHLTEIKKEVNQFAGLCDKQSPLYVWRFDFHIKSEW